ncbi:MAG TPA: DUF5995 family protein [Candidatus Angelobacter sp.]|nr:DUF5995 family protein [Candidatus Angelobacter sp.]
MAAASAPAIPKSVETVEQVIQKLDEIINWAWTQKSRIGYFAALYRRVTRSVKEGIDEGKFQNGPLMEKLDVTFANRYLTAYEQFRSGQATTLSWRLAFRSASAWYPLIVQQLLTGINAHINLDLGIAAAAVAPGEQLAGLKTDFDQINAVLAGEVGTVEKEMAEVSPLIGLLEKFGLRTETVIINFSLQAARDYAWLEATKLAATPPERLPAAIHDLDVRTELFGHLVISPPILIKLQLLPIKLFETRTVRHVIDVLAAQGSAKSAAT